MKRFVNHLFIGTAYGNCSRIINVNLHTGLLNNLIDHLALLADNIANLLRINRNLLDLRRIFAKFFSRLCNNWFHYIVKDVNSCFSRLGNCLLDNRSCKAVDLDVHLNCGDTLMGSAHLEIHVAEEVFKALDIG